MIPDLRARLKAAADKPKPPPSACACQVLSARAPLDAAAAGTLHTLTPRHIRWLGLDHPDFDAGRALFLDTETTGLRGAGTVAFLVGLGWLEPNGDFTVHQLLMRDYPEESDLLEHLADLLPRFDCIVSFNGKSFDIPLLRDRFTMARMPSPVHTLPQLDLLHAARRTWRPRLGQTTLGTLEQAILGVSRENDLPGAEVPERYFRYLKTGDAALLDDVLAHNEQDIRSLALLLAKLASSYEAVAVPEASVISVPLTEQQSMLDILSIGGALEKCGEGALARRCFEVASVSKFSAKARLSLARSYRREQAYVEAADAYRAMIARGEADADVYEALAVLLEWRLRDPRAALNITERALARYAGRGDRETLASLEKRRVRLTRKVRATGP